MRLTEAYDILRGARVGPNVNVDDLHPRFAYRVALLLQKVWAKHGKGSLRIASAVRSPELQAKLRSLWMRGQGNYAVSPTRRIGTVNGVTYRGSWHMKQPDGYGYAVDLQAPSHAFLRTEVHPLLPELGMFWAQGVNEPWHIQAFNRRGWKDGPVPPDEIPEGDEEMITIVDSTTNDAWVVGNGKARKLSDPAKWLSGWDGPVYHSPTMRFVVNDLYQVIVH